MLEMARKARPDRKLWLDRTLSLFADVRAGEGATAALMLVNIFLLLICYSVIKTVREPLILLGGGAEVRSYAAAGQALLLMGLVPLYGWFASRVDRLKLLVGVTLFFVACVELFALAVSAGVPFVGVAFFIWVGIFNMSLVAQFWSFANDLYSKEAGSRLFPVIMLGMTAGAPLGSIAAGRLFGLGFAPQVILQVSAVLLLVSVCLYLVINASERHRAGEPAAPLAATGGFQLVLANPYLRLIAVLIVLLNVVNTTGEYLVARLLSAHVADLAVQPGFDKQAYIGAFSGQYQFWVNVSALTLQAFVTSRLVKYKGLSAALLVLPLIALGGYATIAAGAGFGIVRWIKTAENATDYSIMNTARQMLWLGTSREEKYKAKQAIDTFFVRGGDVLSAGVVYAGTQLLGLSVAAFSAVNVVLALAWLGVALAIVGRRGQRSLGAPRPILATLAAGLATLFISAPASAQETREAQIASQQQEKSQGLRPYEPTALENRIRTAESMFKTERPVYAFIGSTFPGDWLAVGPGFRTRYADTGLFDVHGAWSLKNYKLADASLALPALASGRVQFEVHGNFLDAPDVNFFGLGNDATTTDRVSYGYRRAAVGAAGAVKPARFFSVGGGIDALTFTTNALQPAYLRTSAFAEIDWRPARAYARRGGLYRVEYSDYHERTSGANSFHRLDAEVQQFIPVLRENWIIALRALASTTGAGTGQEVPFFLTPDLGGKQFLRGYPSWRFRDRHRMLLTGEYRWTAGQFVDMSVFLDAGKVEDRLKHLNFDALKTSYGIGAAFHTPGTTVMRVEVARTHDGTSLLWSFGPSF